MKKTISILLSSILILLSLPIAIAEDDDSLKIAVTADWHYNEPREEIVQETSNGIYALEDDIFWYANRRAAMEDESGFIIDEFLSECAESDCEYVLIAGDLADDGKQRPEDHEAVAAKLAEFEENTGKQVFIIPGNHDCGTSGCVTQPEDFYEIYKNFGWDNAIDTSSDDLSYTADLGEKYRLIALDSCAYDKSTEDGMSLAKIKWVVSEAEKAYDEGRYPILMMHHNLLDHMPVQRILSRNFIVKFHYSTAAAFANAGIKIVISGHEHCSDAATYTSTLGNKIYDFATSSLTMYPLSYRTFTLSEDEIKYENHIIDSIDYDALTSTVSGYTDEQLSLMKAGLNEYSRLFLKAGVQYRLELSFQPEKLGVDEDSIFADLVYTAIDRLVELLRMPLYGENSVAELAEKYNIELPESDYETGWDLATSLVAMHYAGEESFDLSSAEVTLLLRCLALILRDDLALVNDEVFMSAATALLESYGLEGMSTEITKLCSSIYGGVKPGEYFVIALISPLLYEFAFDSDGVNDSEGVISGYGSEESNFENLLDKFKGILDSVLLYFNFFLTYFGKIFFIGR